MTTATGFVFRHRYAAQILSVALLISVTTYLVVILSVPPSPWNAVWMVALPTGLGVALNRGEQRIIMGAALLVISLIATTVVGNAMGGY